MMDVRSVLSATRGFDVGLFQGGLGLGVTQREGHNEKMRNVTFMVAKYEKAASAT